MWLKGLNVHNPMPLSLHFCNEKRASEVCITNYVIALISSTQFDWRVETLVTTIISAPISLAFLAQISQTIDHRLGFCYLEMNVTGFNTSLWIKEKESKVQEQAQVALHSRYLL